MRVALFQPDIAGNVGAILRLAACWRVPVDIIMPCGFPWSDKALKRSAMDYVAGADVTRHADWAQFAAVQREKGRRIIGLTTHGDAMLHDTAFASDDVLLMGRESAGLPGDVRAGCAAAVRIPMAAEFRSLNLAVAAGIALGEALRQTGQFPQ